MQEHELEALAHDYLHQSHSDTRSRSPSPIRARRGTPNEEKIRSKEMPDKKDAVGFKNEGFTNDDCNVAVETEAKKPPNSR